MYPDSNPICIENAGLIKILTPVNLPIGTEMHPQYCLTLKRLAFATPVVRLSGQRGSSRTVKIPKFSVPVFGDGNKQASSVFLITSSESLALWL